MELKKLLRQETVQPYLAQAHFGVEREGQRVTLDGALATTDHPACLGNRSYNPYIQTDFSETQMELITPVADSLDDLFDYLEAIHDVAWRSIPKNEQLWPLSMPPELPEKDEDIMIAKLSAHEDVLYRRYLAREYGKRKQMVSGIHFNFEYGRELVEALAIQQSQLSLEEFKTQLYLKAARNYLHYRWLITYLFGASPQSEKGYFTKNDQEIPDEPIRSIRSSHFGYKNNEDVHVSYRSLEGYLADIERMIEEGKLSEEKEFYAPLRFRGGQKVSDLVNTGIKYIELRNIDINPFERVGLSKEQARFLHLFLLYMLWIDEVEDPDAWVEQGEVLNERVALEHPLHQTALQNEGLQLLESMKEMIQELKLDALAENLTFAEERLIHPEKTIAGCLYSESQKITQQQVAMNLASGYQRDSYQAPYQLAGFREMELSTQILLFDTIQKGISFSVLDRQDQFLKLQFGSHVEYVKNANMTSKDTYIVPLMMENKVVTKKVLSQAGFRVPMGMEFTSQQSAEKAYARFAKQAFVIKPKSTNYGLGITIFKQGASFEDYQEGLKIAFAEDAEVLVEEYLPGTEYRFFVIDHQVKAILLRVPANVQGDGVHTIAELVATKNQDPLRGTHHRAPLELIQLGALEQLMLKEQHMTIDSIPKQDQVIYLRENSNVSTGGDSIDVTDEIPEAYKQIACNAVDTLGAAVSGIDLIIPDKDQDPFEVKNAYGIIEANFNPAMHMHTYPYAGQSRRLTMDVLRMLYPEVFLLNHWHE